MKTFKDVSIRVSEEKVVGYMDDVTANLKKPWRRAYENEKNSIYLGEVAFCFQREDDSKMPAAGLSIFKKNNNIWYIPNVIPIKSMQLSYEEYNEIISEFYNNYLLPISKKHNIIVDISDGELTDENIVGKTSARLLNTFSDCANKSTGSAHPMDRKRWFAFIVESSKLQEEIDVFNLNRLLQQQGWSEEIASELIIEFEFGRDLIKYIGV